MVLSDSQREMMLAELRNAGLDGELEMRRILDLAVRYVNAHPRHRERTPEEWRLLYETAPSSRERSALVVSKHLEGWLRAWTRDGSAPVGGLSPTELQLLSLDRKRARVVAS